MAEQGNFRFVALAADSIIGHSNNMKELYQRIGHGPATHRRPDARIFGQIRQLLQWISSLLNVGTGSGSHEPDDSMVISVVRFMKGKPKQPWWHYTS